MLHRLADLIEQHADELAAIESLDNGKLVGVTKAGLGGKPWAVIVTSLGGRTRFTGRRFLSMETFFVTRGTSRSGLLAKSCRGIFRC
jgi:hypothetical protein